MLFLVLITKHAIMKRYGFCSHAARTNDPRVRFACRACARELYEKAPSNGESDRKNNKCQPTREMSRFYVGVISNHNHEITLTIISFNFNRT